MTAAEFCREIITEQISKCDDVDLLDLICKILLKSISDPECLVIIVDDVGELEE